MPIGRPIGNTTMYVLDRNMQPVPIGVRGELYIGGAGVARGYLGASQLTAERFVADPFSTEAGCTAVSNRGLVRQRRDGKLEFIGRVDFQTKMRGYRIEPAEIESVLREYPGCSRRQSWCVIIPAKSSWSRTLSTVRSERVPVRCHADANRPRPRRQLGQAEVTRFLRKRLPDYMVPSAFVVLDALPVTPNGKLDWKAFPAPQHRVQEIALILPRDATEARLARIWEEVLDVHPVGITDNFFELGGDSLLGTHLFARVEEEFAKRVPLGTLFEAPTIEKLAAILRQDSWVSSSLIASASWGSIGATNIFRSGTRWLSCLSRRTRSRPTLLCRSYDDLFVSDTERSLSDLAAELAQRIRDYHPHGPYYLGGMCLAGRVAFAIACELRRQGEEVALLAIIDRPAPAYAQLSRASALRNFIDRLHWHMHYVLHGNRQQKIDWIAGGFLALGWQARYRAWQLARLFFRRIGRPLPQSLRHPPGS